MNFKYHPKLATLLKNVEQFLIATIPNTVRSLHINEPVYAVFLWYQDSSVADGFAPQFGVGTESVLLACNRQYPTDRLAATDCRWRPQQVVEDMNLVRQRGFPSTDFMRECNEAYSIMLAANETGRPLPDEGELLWPFRAMMHSVATRLNEIDWKNFLNITDDFVVVSLDSIGNWLAEDLKESMSAGKYLMLQKRNLLFDSE